MFGIMKKRIAPKEDKTLKMMKKLLCAAMAVVMLVSFAGCSTPEVAITVDGKDYPTGEYLAYLLDGFQQAYYNGGLYYYEQYGTDIWAEEYTYGEDEKKVKLDEYLKLQTVDTIVRQKALENKIAEAGVKFSEELTKQAQEMVDAVTEEELLTFGVNKEHYTAMCMAYYRNELALFLSRYDKDGSSPVAEADIRKYFDDNYLSYKMISIPMVDSDKKEFTADKQKETKDTLQKYLDMYNKGGDFNKVIAQYNYDISTSKEKELADLKDSDTRQDVDMKNASDEDLAKAVKGVPEGKAQIVTYSAGGTTLTAALILRLDPEKGEGYENYFADSRQNILMSLKYEEFDKEISDYAKTLTYEVNKTAYRICNPKKFVQQ